MAKKELPPEVLDFLRKSGSNGGKKTAKKYGRKQMADWGKLGGRPRKSVNSSMKEGKKKGNSNGIV